MICVVTESAASGHLQRVSAIFMFLCVLPSIHLIINQGCCATTTSPSVLTVFLSFLYERCDTYMFFKSVFVFGWLPCLPICLINHHGQCAMTIFLSLSLSLCHPSSFYLSLLSIYVFLFSVMECCHLFYLKSVLWFWLAAVPAYLFDLS